MRAAIYARFSSDLQNDRSIEDQVALCESVCARAGFTVVATFADRAVSGSALANRPQAQAMLAAAATKSFDVLVAAEIDRIARDQGDFHFIRKRLEFHGIAIHTPAGAVSRIDGSLRALMGEMFLDNLIAHTRRGMAGVVRAGRHAGGRAYGYRATGEAGVLRIQETEAAIVRRIFEAYAAGERPRAIAAALNADGVPPPRGQHWNASTINGSRARGTGILFNPLYKGELVWNRLRMVKDPATGKRLSRVNPESEVMRVAAPQLAIVDTALFARVQALKMRRAQVPGPLQQRPRRIFSGLLRCGTCGAGMTSLGARGKSARIQCSAHRESGVCTNGRMVDRAAVERLALKGLKEATLNPRRLAIYVAEYNAERRRLAAAADSDRIRLTRRHGEVKREVARAVDALLKGLVPAEALSAPMRALEAERSAIEGKLAAIDAAPEKVALHPKALARYAGDIAQLEALLADNAQHQSDALIEAIRRLVERVVVIAAPDERGFAIEIKGRLAALIGASDIIQDATGGDVMVAGEGFEPPTRGL